MRRRSHRLRVLLALTALLPVAAASQTLRLATWNLEWLVSDQTVRTARAACQAGARPALPCEVALDGARDSADYAVLAGYAHQLDADVIALQEVEDADTASRVLPGYRFCLSSGRGLQNLGFAIRRGVPYRCEPDYQPLELEGRLRRGGVLTLFPGTPAQTRLLAVHLKSGCARPRRKADASACQQWQRQLPLLSDWVAAQTGPFAVLGDFNRELAPDDPGGLLASLQAAARRNGGLQDAAAGTRLGGCWPGQPQATGIDHLLLGGGLQAQVINGPARRLGFRAADVRRHTLSDHCPVSIRLRFSTG